MSWLGPYSVGDFLYDFQNVRRYKIRLADMVRGPSFGEYFFCIRTRVIGQRLTRQALPRRAQLPVRNVFYSM